MTSDTALLIAHEIWGVNSHIRAVAEYLRVATGYDVVTPSYLNEEAPIEDEPEADVYRSFMESLGIDGMASRIVADAERLHEDYNRVLCIGFSVGATATWVAAQSKHLDASVCVYGSRIRDHLSPGPASPTLVVLAEQETSFTPRNLLPQLRVTPHVTARITEGTSHGYCNPNHKGYDARAADRTYDEICAFLLKLE